MPTTTTIPQRALKKTDSDIPTPAQTAVGASLVIADKIGVNIVIPKMLIIFENLKNADFLFNIGFLSASWD